MIVSVLIQHQSEAESIQDLVRGTVPYLNANAFTPSTSIERYSKIISNMSDTTAVKRQLKIQANVVKRLSKEHKLYRTEAEDQKKKVDKFLAEGAEEWDIKNGRRVLDEAHRMILDSETRLAKAVTDLRETVVFAQKSPSEFAETEEYKLAEAILQEANT